MFVTYFSFLNVRSIVSNTFLYQYTYKQTKNWEATLAPAHYTKTFK